MMPPPDVLPRPDFPFWGRGKRRAHGNWASRVKLGGGMSRGGDKWHVGGGAPRPGGAAGRLGDNMSINGSAGSCTGGLPSRCGVVLSIGGAPHRLIWR
eukprot:6267780-Pyramimonas_sp.AAC.1